MLKKKQGDKVEEDEKMKLPDSAEKTDTERFL